MAESTTPANMKTNIKTTLFHCTCRIGYSATANCCPRMKWRGHLFGHLLLVRRPRRGGNKTTESSWVSSCSKGSKIQSSHLKLKIFEYMQTCWSKCNDYTSCKTPPQTTSSSPLNWHMTLIDIPTPRSFCAPPQVALLFDKDASTSACSSCILALHSDQRPVIHRDTISDNCMGKTSRNFFLLVVLSAFLQEQVIV